jgi:rSAM/selenodomain-associated transferase 1
MKTVVLVFAKAPQIGKVKTRLGKRIGMEQSHWVYLQLLKQTAQALRKSKIETVLFENQTHKTLHTTFEYARYYQIQKGKDLGEKMKNAFQWAFKQGYEKVLIIGSDLWTLDENTLLKAQRTLVQSDFVIGPAYDGGYYLLGMKEPTPALFENKNWSTDTVLKETLLDIKDKSVVLLDKKNDIDTLEDLKNTPELYNAYKIKFYDKQD